MKRFAKLSSASLLFGLNSGCGKDSSEADPVNKVLYGPAPLYGPVPVSPEVSGIYYGGGSNLTLLYGNPSVPINSTFVIKFSTNMDTSARVTVSLKDGSNNTVDLNTAWQDALSLTDATDASGAKITIGPGATAVFKTAAA